MGEGDCDWDSQCARGLRCGSGNCYRGAGSPFEADDDCCEPLPCGEEQSYLNLSPTYRDPSSPSSLVVDCATAMRIAKEGNPSISSTLDYPSLGQKMASTVERSQREAYCTTGYTVLEKKCN